MPDPVDSSTESELVFDEAPARALAVYAHPDDPEISCGGTLAVWARAGTKVHVLICTRGEKGSSEPSVDVEKLARLRAREITAAGKILGLSGHAQLSINDGEIENTSEVRELIVATIRRVRPDVVVCPDPTAVFFGESYYNHHDHRIVGWATLDSVAPAASNPHYFPDAGTHHEVATVFLSGTLEPNVWVDISTTMGQKIEALSCHKSQLGDRDSEWVREAVEQRAREGGRIAGVAMAEGFRRLSLAG